MTRYLGDTGHVAAHNLLETNLAALGNITAPGAPASRTPLQRSGDVVMIDDFSLPADAGDWALALTRALAYATPLGRAVMLNRMYAVATTVTLTAGNSIVGNGATTGLIAPTNAPLTILQGNSITGLSLRNFMIDGGVTPALTTKSFVRGVRFIACTTISLTSMTVQRCADWAMAFEQSQDIKVFNYTHLLGGQGTVGGKDGIHFMDCDDVYLDTARIWSGDDCVGITSSTRDIHRITIRNVVGYSDVAAVVTLGNESTSAFAAYDIAAQNIASYRPQGTTQDISFLVKMLAQNSSIAQRLTVNNVSGTVRSYGVWLQGSSTNLISEAVVSNVNVIANGGHGLALVYVKNFTATGIFAKSISGNFDGIYLGNCAYGSITATTDFSNEWGFQVNACTNIDLTGCVALNCGAGVFASNTGGGMVLVGTTNCFVNGGSFIGTTTASYYGIFVSGGTGAVVSAGTRRAGLNP